MQSPLARISTSLLTVAFFWSAWLQPAHMILTTGLKPLIQTDMSAKPAPDAARKLDAAAKKAEIDHERPETAAASKAKKRAAADSVSASAAATQAAD